jgi:hypothetical protein
MSNKFGLAKVSVFNNDTFTAINVLLDRLALISAVGFL